MLGISPTIDKSLIKKAYRKKALQYHPDRNKLPTAHEKFLALTEAYEALMDPVMTKAKSPAYPHKTTDEILAERMRAARQRFNESKKKEAKEELIYFKKMTSGVRGLFFRSFGYFSLFVALLWIVDYEVLEQKGFDFESGATYSNGNQVCYAIKGRKYCFESSAVGLSSLLTGKAYFSPIFNDLRVIEYGRFNNEMSKISPVFGFNSAFPFLFPLLLMPFFTYSFQRPSVVFTLSYLFSSTVIVLVVSVRLLTIFF